MTGSTWQGPLIVYRLEVQRGLYQELAVDDAAEFGRRFQHPFSGRRMQISLSPIRCRTVGSQRSRADFTYLAPGTVVIADEIVRRTPDLHHVGELLPVLVDGVDERYALNVTNIVNVLDAAKSKPTGRQSSASGLREYAFHAHRLSLPSIFKIPETAAAEILAIQGINNCPEDEFPVEFQRNHFTGLKLVPVWTQE